MRQTDTTIDGLKKKPVRVIQYDNTGDVAATLRGSKHGMESASIISDDDWSGGDVDDFMRVAEQGSTKYVERVEAQMRLIADQVFETHGMEYEYNTVNGILDWQAMEAGLPDCMYGPVPTQSETAPISIYVDLFASAMIPKEVITRRGVAVMALAQKLSETRAVTVNAVLGTTYTPEATAVVQVIPLPTNPMDISRVAAVLCDPVFLRVGLLSNVNSVMNNYAYCPAPIIDAEWQRNKFAWWLSDLLHPKSDVVFLPMLYGRQTEFGTDEASTKWVNDRLREHNV